MLFLFVIDSVTPLFDCGKLCLKLLSELLCYEGSFGVVGCNFCPPDCIIIGRKSLDF